MKLLEVTLERIAPQSLQHREEGREHILDFAMPRWALGRVFDLAVDLAGMTRCIRPSVKRKNIVMMAADHGVYAEGISNQPQSVTAQVIFNTVRGGGGISVLSRNAGAVLTVVDMGINGDMTQLAESGKIIDKKIAMGTDNMAKGPAMTREQAIACLEAGIEVAIQLNADTDIFGTGEMGIGNTTPSSAIAAVLCGISDISLLVDRGAGLPEDQLPHKAKVIDTAIKLNQPDPDDGIDVLAKVGGFEIGGLAGLILGAASLKKPIMIDGFITTAAALVAQAICPDSVDYMIFAHGSMERGHHYMLEKLGKKPLLDLDMRLGEGSGAALAMNIADAACAMMAEMSTFSGAQIVEDGL